MARVPTTDQMDALARAHLDVAPGRPGLNAIEHLAERLSIIFGTQTIIFHRSGGEWRRATGSSGPPPPVLRSEDERLIGSLVHPESTARTGSFVTDSGTWTLAGSGGRSPVVLAVLGEWNAGSLLTTVQNISLSLLAASAEDRARTMAAVHRLSRQLANTNGSRAVWDLTLHSMATAVDARLAALAVPSVTDQRLRIVSTYGYPIELVEHLRIASGSGVLGSVFETGRLLHVENATRVPSLRPRPRYRTPSFVVVPIGGPRNLLGIACFADRGDDQVFTREDVTRLRALAAPAALALGRERVASRAERYARMATVDGLSGAFNRRYFHARLEEELQRSRRQRTTIALLMLDLDDFKAINDTYGHLGGDRVIQDISGILRRSVRVFDVCARLGGEEFAVLMPNTTVESASKIAGRIRSRIESYRSQEPSLGNLRVTASIGLAISDSTLTGRDLLGRSDEALYEAKRRGKNRLCIRGPERVRELSAAP